MVIVLGFRQLVEKFILTLVTMEIFWLMFFVLASSHRIRFFWAMPQVLVIQLFILGPKQDVMEFMVQVWLRQSLMNHQKKSDPLFRWVIHLQKNC